MIAVFMLQRYIFFLRWTKKNAKYENILGIFLRNSKKSSTFAAAKGLRKQRKLLN